MLTAIPTYISDAAPLVEAYRQFWASANRLADRTVNPREVDIEARQERPGKSLLIRFGENTGFIALENMPTREKSDVSAYDIYIRGTQIVDRIMDAEHQRWRILGADFSVLYLNALETSRRRRAWRERETVSRAFAGYRFRIDSGERSQPHRPDCHGVYCLDAISEEAIERLYVENGQGGWSARARRVQPCVPTAPMDFVALFYMILHSHYQGAVRTGWPKQVAESLASLPCLVLPSDERSRCSAWYDHSHLPQEVAPVQPLRDVPSGFRIPDALKTAGWTAKVSGRERTESPHVTLVRHGDRFRWNLRSGELMDGDERAVPDSLLQLLKRSWRDWRTLWDERYPENPVRAAASGEREPDDKKPR